MHQTTAPASDASAASKASSGSTPHPPESLPESVEEFDVLVSSVDKYEKLSKQLGGVVAQQVRIASPADLARTAQLRANDCICDAGR